MKNNFLLDADETVLDFIRSSEESFRAAMNELGERQAAERYAEFKEINDGLWREYERGEICKKDLMTARFSRFLQDCKAVRTRKKQTDCILTNCAGRGICCQERRDLCGS